VNQANNNYSRFFQIRKLIIFKNKIWTRYNVFRCDTLSAHTWWDSGFVLSNSSQKVKYTLNLSREFHSCQ